MKIKQIGMRSQRTERKTAGVWGVRSILMVAEDLGVDVIT